MSAASAHVVTVLFAWLFTPEYSIAIFYEDEQGQVDLG